MTPRSPRRLSVLLRSGDIDPSGIQGRVAVLADVLRATSVIPAALAADAAAMLPVASLDEAMALRAARPDALLCGEKDGRPRPGFDFGNSPSEYTPVRVGGRTLIYTSTNGVPALLALRSAVRVFTGAFVNESAVSKALLSRKEDVLLVAAGSDDRASLEDVAFCGGLVARLLDSDTTFVVDDCAQIALSVWYAWRGDVAGILAASSHGATLVAWGWGDDLVWCAKRNVLSVVPVLEDDRLVALGGSR